MATIAGMNLTTPRVIYKPVDSLQKAQTIKFPVLLNLNNPLTKFGTGRAINIRAVRAAPEKLSQVVEQTIKEAQETCADDPNSGECAAAWDNVEEASAAASHAKDKQKASDPLEKYCDDNPETDECRTYDN